MPTVAANLLLLFLAGSIVWWQTRFIRQRIPKQEYQGDRGMLIGIGAFITIILGLNAVNFMENLEVDWYGMMDSLDPPGRVDLLIRQAGFLCGFYAFAMVFWSVIRRTVLDLQREVSEPRREYGLGEKGRLIVGIVLAAISMPAVVRNAFRTFESTANGIVLLVMIPVALFSIELLFGVAMAKFVRLSSRGAQGESSDG